MSDCAMPIRQIHEPGQCDSDYPDCNGAARYVPDPFAADVWGETHYGWYCDGRYKTSCNEI
jgi:hypothetical protein